MIATLMHDNWGFCICPDKPTSLIICSDVIVANKLDLSKSEMVKNSGGLWRSCNNSYKGIGRAVDIPQQYSKQNRQIKMSTSPIPGHQVMQVWHHMQQGLIWQGGRQKGLEGFWWTQTLRHSLDNNDGIQHDYQEYWGLNAWSLPLGHWAVS